MEQGLETLRRAITNPTHGYRTIPANRGALHQRLRSLQNVVETRGTPQLYASLEFLLHGT